MVAHPVTAMLRILLPLLLAALPLAAQAPKKGAAPKAETLSGCVDQKEGRYVLTDDAMLKTLAILEWVDQDQDNFARYVGHKVTVTGRRDGRTDPPAFRVTSLKNVSDVCAP